MAIECHHWHVGPPVKRDADGFTYLFCAECQHMLNKENYVRMHRTYLEYIAPLKRGEFTKLPPKAKT